MRKSAYEIRIGDLSSVVCSSALFETVADEVMEIGSTDANSQVMRVRAQKPDVVFDSFASAAESAAMYKSLQRFDVKAQRWAQNNLTASPKIWELAGDAVDGALEIGRAHV